MDSLFLTPSFNIVSGVAAVCASKKDVLSPFGIGQEVICEGNEIIRKTLPTSAGLNILFPKPPKLIFPMPIAANAPIAIIQIGRLAGILKASSIPVISAEPSKIDALDLSKKVEIRYSKSRQKMTEENITIIAETPKR